MLGLGLADLVNPHVRRALKQRLQTCHDVVVEKFTGEVCLRIILTVEAVQNLNVFVPNQKFFRASALDLGQERLLKLRVDSGSGGAIRRLDIECDFEINHMF
jgi:hypothetical protein